MGKDILLTNQQTNRSVELRIYGYEEQALGELGLVSGVRCSIEAFKEFMRKARRVYVAADFGPYSLEMYCDGPVTAGKFLPDHDPHRPQPTLSVHHEGRVDFLSTWWNQSRKVLSVHSFKSWKAW